MKTFVSNVVLKSGAIELSKTWSLFWRSPLEESDTQASNFKARSVIVEVWIKSEEEAGSWSREHLFGAST